jgi:hypothetical protein
MQNCCSFCKYTMPLHHWIERSHIHTGLTIGENMDLREWIKRMGNYGLKIQKYDVMV